MPHSPFGLLPCLLLLGCSDPPPVDGSAFPLETTTARAEAPVRPDTVSQDNIAPTPAATLPATPPPAPASRPAPVAPPPPTNTAPAAPPAQPRTVATSSFAPNHAPWNDLLQRYVSAKGNVDYSGLQRDRGRLDKYLTTLSQDAPDGRWTKEERLAYWINAYNAFTIQLILDNWPVNSIRDIKEPWDQKFITLEGRAYSLNQIEHQIIRPTFAEPRIHFALVCAAVSCPPLANQAYTAANLDRLLEARTRSFINDEKFNVTQEAVVRVSPLFDWYADDFGEPKAFINRYLTTDIPPQKDLHFLDYDWELND